MKIVIIEWIILLAIAWWVAYTINIVTEINDKVTMITESR